MLLVLVVKWWKAKQILHKAFDYRNCRCFLDYLQAGRRHKCGETLPPRHRCLRKLLNLDFSDSIRSFLRKQGIFLQCCFLYADLLMHQGRESDGEMSHAASRSGSDSQESQLCVASACKPANELNDDIDFWASLPNIKGPFIKYCQVFQARFRTVLHDYCIETDPEDQRAKGFVENILPELQCRSKSSAKLPLRHKSLRRTRSSTAAFGGIHQHFSQAEVLCRSWEPSGRVYPAYPAARRGDSSSCRVLVCTSLDGRYRLMVARLPPNLLLRQRWERTSAPKLALEGKCVGWSNNPNNLNILNIPNYQNYLNNPNNSNNSNNSNNLNISNNSFSSH